MTQTELATRSNLGLSTIVDFEKSRRQVSMEAITAIKAALERAGIEFIAQTAAVLAFVLNLFEPADGSIIAVCVGGTSAAGIKSPAIVDDPDELLQQLELQYSLLPLL